jgi:transcriptional regulator with XRE-family HTH domain
MQARFASWFRQTRDEKGLSQTEAAEQLKLSSPTLSRWEQGTEPRVSHLIRISKWAPIAADKLLKLFDG